MPFFKMPTYGHVFMSLSIFPQHLKQNKAKKNLLEQQQK